jgi:mono/diheme cytochrome c family protein
MLTAALATVALAVTACGSGGHRDVNLARGRELFLVGANGKQGCAFCHTLAAAAADGPFGPDLDEESRGLTRARFEQLVLHQIADPVCLNPNDPGRCMPTSIVSGEDAADVAAYVARCAHRAGTLGCRPSFDGRRGEVGEGEHLFAREGCVSCHWTNGGIPIGPPLNGLYGSKVRLADGKTVAADATYIIDSILLPDAQIVNGYPRGYMSARVSPEHLSLAQAMALLAYIKTLR